MPFRTGRFADRYIVTVAGAGVAVADCSEGGGGLRSGRDSPSGVAEPLLHEMNHGVPISSQSFKAKE